MNESRARAVCILVSFDPSESCRGSMKPAYCSSGLRSPGCIYTNAFDNIIRVSYVSLRLWHSKKDGGYKRCIHTIALFARGA